MCHEYAIGAGAFSVDDDPGLVVNEIVGVISKKWISVLPCNPGRLWVGQRDLFWRLASVAASARTAIIGALLIIVGGIKSSKILADRARRLLGLRPGNGLVTGTGFFLPASALIRLASIENPPDQMIHRHHFVEIERVKELTLAPLPPTIIDRSPANRILTHEITVQPQSQREFLQHNPPKADLALAPRQAEGALRCDRTLVIPSYQTGELGIQSPAFSAQLLIGRRCYLADRQLMEKIGKCHKVPPNPSPAGTGSAGGFISVDFCRATFFLDGIFSGGTGNPSIHFEKPFQSLWPLTPAMSVFKSLGPSTFLPIIFMGSRSLD